MKPPLHALLCVGLALTGCDSRKPADETVRRAGHPDVYNVSEADPEMEKAIRTARETVDRFIAALKSPGPKQSSFSVKKPFKDGEKVEHIWLSDASYDGKRFHGRVDNEPVDVKNVKMGTTATVAKDELSDWFYIDGGKLVGGYTLRVLYSRMSPEDKKEFDAHADFKIE